MEKEGSMQDLHKEKDETSVGFSKFWSSYIFQILRFLNSILRIDKNMKTVLEITVNIDNM